MTRQKRFDFLDAMRGSAVIQMIFFHLCFLLKEFDIAFLDFSSNWWWLNFRTLIVFQFLLLVGISLKIATNEQFNLVSFIRRLVQLILYAGTVTLTTHLLEPQRVVTFGVLHFIFVATILAVIFVKFSFYNVILAIGVGAAGLFYQFEILNSPWLNWVGMVSDKPVTLDYVPLFPWFSVVLLGLYVGQLIISAPAFLWLRRWQANIRLSKILVLIGRHSLNLYMLHMPLLYGMIYLLLKPIYFNGSF